MKIYNVYILDTTGKGYGEKYSSIIHNFFAKHHPDKSVNCYVAYPSVGHAMEEELSAKRILQCDYFLMLFYECRYNTHDQILFARSKDKQVIEIDAAYYNQSLKASQSCGINEFIENLAAPIPLRKHFSSPNVQHSVDEFGDIHGEDASLCSADEFDDYLKEIMEEVKPKASRKNRNCLKSRFLILAIILPIVAVTIIYKHKPALFVNAIHWLSQKINGHAVGPAILSFIKLSIVIFMVIVLLLIFLINRAANFSKVRFLILLIALPIITVTIICKTKPASLQKVIHWLSQQINGPSIGPPLDNSIKLSIVIYIIIVLLLIFLIKKAIGFVASIFSYVHSDSKRTIASPIENKFTIVSSSYDVFISYAHENTHYDIDELIDYLRSICLNPWFDGHMTRSIGGNYNEMIASHILECGKFIPLINQEYINSEYCRDEFFYARAQNKHIVPIFLEKVQLTPGMEMRLMQQIQCINLYDYADYDNFYSCLKSALKS